MKIIHKIRTNHIYKFLARVFLVALVTSIAWVSSLTFYNKIMITNGITSTIEKEKTILTPLIKNVDFEKKNENYKVLKLYLENIIKEKDTIYIDFFHDGKLVLHINSHKPIPHIVEKAISILKKDEKDNLQHIIPVNSENAYLYLHYKLNIDGENFYINLLTKLNEAATKKLQDDVEDSLFILISTIVLMFFAIFPIIYSQYKQMTLKQNELIQSNLNTLISLGNAIAKRDSDTSEHNYRVTYYSIKLAEKLTLPPQQIQTLIKGSFLHDIGKIAISDNILLKPSKLNEDEFKIMKTHVTEGIDIVKNDQWLSDAQKVILNHHEKFDGSGYPNQLKGNSIPIEARIFAVADVFDALTSQRPYKKPYSIDKSFHIIKQNSGTHFDSDIVDAFEEIYKELYISVKNKTNKELEAIFYGVLNPYFFTEDK